MDKLENVNIHNFAHATYPMPDGTPKFIGEIIQRFNIRKELLLPFISH